MDKKEMNVNTLKDLIGAEEITAVFLDDGKHEVGIGRILVIEYM